jgi:hypothetical protein|tara:strand:- start:241 stop:483 length:243 start_codon:yes stop_codon:yes gene_type:complete
MENKLLQALLSHYQCEIHKAEADLLIYFKSPSGIGEHGKVVDEMINHIDRISAARGGLSTVQSLVSQEEQAQTSEPPSQE